MHLAMRERDIWWLSMDRSEEKVDETGRKLKQVKSEISLSHLQSQQEHLQKMIDKVEVILEQTSKLVDKPEQVPGLVHTP